MLKIRLQNPTKNDLCKAFNIVAIDSRKKRDGFPIEILGTYTLYSDGKKKLELNKASILIRLSQGAVLSKGLFKILRPVLVKWNK
jgi:ribosomal protein S16